MSYLELETVTPNDYILSLLVQDRLDKLIEERKGQKITKSEGRLIVEVRKAKNLSAVKKIVEKYSDFFWNIPAAPVLMYDGRKARKCGTKYQKGKVKESNNQFSLLPVIRSFLKSYKLGEVVEALQEIGISRLEGGKYVQASSSLRGKYFDYPIDDKAREKLKQIMNQDCEPCLLQAGIDHLQKRLPL